MRSVRNGGPNGQEMNSIRPIIMGQPNGSLDGQHQGPMVQWESYLPVRSLKVLLVENDDSTRHVVTALLRNCSYQVTAVSNGLQAWKLLIDINMQIDLVLTEVVMPYLSGIGLLSKIMNHVTRKNIPVIMMSSDDSMGIVFNCLSRGAVDFLVKPIRKNELKNLWQHVWRKCHSSSGSGSGSESGIRDHKSTKSRSIEESDDDSDEDDEVSIELNAKGGSDNGSGTQSSWPKRIVEVDSSQENILWDKVPNPYDNISAQVAKTETSKLEIIEMGKDLKIGVPKSLSFGLEDINEKKMDKFCESNMKNVDVKLDNGMQLGCEIGNKSIYYSKESRPIELSLKRTNEVDNADISAQDRSFSRYKAVSNINQAPTANVDSCSSPDIHLEPTKPNNIQSNSTGTPNNRSNGTDNMGSTTNNAFKIKPDYKQPPNVSTTVVVHNHLQPILPRPIENDAVKTTMGQPKAVQQQVQVRHHHHHYHHHHHHVHKRQQPKLVKPNDGSVGNMVSNVLTASNAANFGRVSRSNNNGDKKTNGGDGSGSGSGVDQERLARREVALNKFRQKRKERCFEKKVRYESKKKLAEQRPRVRGQFVRHGGKNEDAYNV